MGDGGSAVNTLYTVPIAPGPKLLGLTIVPYEHGLWVTGSGPEVAGTAAEVPPGHVWTVDGRSAVTPEELQGVLNQLQASGRKEVSMDVRDVPQPFDLDISTGEGLGIDFEFVQLEGLPSQWLYITNIQPGSPAARVGMTPDTYINTVDGQLLQTPDDFKQLIDAARRRGARTLSVEVGYRPWESPPTKPLPMIAGAGQPSADHRGSISKVSTHGEPTPDEQQLAPDWQPAKNRRVSSALPPPSAAPSDDPQRASRVSSMLPPPSESPTQEERRVSSQREQYQFPPQEVAEDEALEPDEVEVVLDTGDRFCVTVRNLRSVAGPLAIRKGARVFLWNLPSEDAEYEGAKGTIARLPEDTDPDRLAEFAGRTPLIDWQEWLRERRRQTEANKGSRGAQQPPAEPRERTRTLSAPELGGQEQRASGEEQGAKPLPSSLAARRRGSGASQQGRQAQVIDRVESQAITVLESGMPAESQQESLARGPTARQESFARGPSTRLRSGVLARPSAGRLDAPRRPYGGPSSGQLYQQQEGAGGLPRAVMALAQPVWSKDAEKGDERERNRRPSAAESSAVAPSRPPPAPGGAGSWGMPHRLGSHSVSFAEPVSQARPGDATQGALQPPQLVPPPPKPQPATPAQPPRPAPPPDAAVLSARQASPRHSGPFRVRVLVPPG